MPDFQKVRLLAQKLPVADLPALVGLSKSVVEQYVELLRQYEPELALCCSESEPHAGSFGDEPVPAPAGTTARRTGRVKGDIAVGLPVTQQPPHRSRRAVFPHRAPQKYSLPQSNSDQLKLSRPVPSSDSWSLYPVVFE